MARALMQQGSSTAPVQSPLEGIARALQGGLGGYIGGRAKQSKADAMTAALTALGDQSLAPDARLQAAVTAYGDKDSFGDNPMMAALLQARVQAALPKDEKPTVLSPGQQAFGRDGKSLYSVPAATDKPTGIVAEYEYAKKQGYVGSMFDYQKAKAEAGRTPAQGHAPPTEIAGYNLAKQQGFPGSFMDYQTARIRPPAGSQEERDDAILFDPNADTRRPEYHAAYYRRTQPKPTMVPDEKGVMTMSAVSPSLPSNVRPPGNMQPPPEALQQLAGPPPGSTPAPEVIPQDPGMPSNASGLNVRPIAPPAVDRAAKAKMDTAIGEAATLSNALDDYVKAFEGAGAGEIVKSVAGVNTPSNTAYSNAALLAKGDVLYQLGVLNGPDLTILQKTLADPSTFKGQAAGPEGARAAADTVRRLIQDRINAARKQQDLPALDIAEYGRGLRGDGSGTTPPPPPGFKAIN